MIEEYILITTIGEIKTVEIETDLFLDKCYELINCDCIEVCVPLFPKKDTAVRFILDDSGKLNGQKFNPLATLFYNRPDVLFGNVLIGKLGLNQYGEMSIVGFEFYETDELLNYLLALADELKKNSLL